MVTERKMTGRIRRVSVLVAPPSRHLQHRISAGAVLADLVSVLTSTADCTLLQFAAAALFPCTVERLMIRWWPPAWQSDLHIPDFGALSLI